MSKIKIINPVLIRSQGEPIDLNEANLYAYVRTVRDMRFWEKRLRVTNPNYVIIEGDSTLNLHGSSQYVTGYFIFCKGGTA